jgi:hypothetical protein
MKSTLFGETATITRETARSSQKQSFYKTDKLARFLPGFRYTEMSATIERMAKSYLEEGGNKAK